MEQRYNLLQPSRTESNIRYYDDRELKLILNISLLKEKGFKISQIANMTYESIAAEVKNMADNACKYPDQVHSLMVAMIDLDEERFEKIMAHNILSHGFEKTMMFVVFPFMQKIGLMWLAGSVNPAQEHFITHLIRQKLMVAIDQLLYKSKADSKLFLLFLPEGELHEISLLFAHFLIRSRGHKSVYLGQSLPVSDLIEVYKIHQPSFIFTILTSPTKHDSVEDYLNNLSTNCSTATIMATGYQVVNQPLVLNDNIRIIGQFQDFIDHLEK